MRSVYESLKKELLYGKFKANLTYKGNTLELSEIDSGVNIKGSVPTNSVVIRYDGYSFIAKEINGDVYVNNSRIDRDYVFSGSAVITLGSPALRWNRTYVTFDISHPEVVL
jgi:serine/threonine-protein kinase